MCVWGGEGGGGEVGSGGRGAKGRRQKKYGRREEETDLWSKLKG